MLKSTLSGKICEVNQNLYYVQPKTRILNILHYHIDIIVNNNISFMHMFIHTLAIMIFLCCTQRIAMGKHIMVISLVPY